MEKEIYFVRYITVKRLVWRIYEKFLQSINKTETTQVKHRYSSSISQHEKKKNPPAHSPKICSFGFHINFRIVCFSFVQNAFGNKEEQSWRYRITWYQSIFQLYCINQKSWYWHKNRHKYQWSRKENPEINPLLYGKLTYDKRGKNTQWVKTVSSINGDRKTVQIHAKNKIRQLYYTLYKTKLKMNYLNIRPETIKVLIENVGRISFDIILSNFFFFAYIS